MTEQVDKPRSRRRRPRHRGQRPPLEDFAARAKAEELVQVIVGSLTPLVASVVTSLTSMITAAVEEAYLRGRFDEREAALRKEILNPPGPLLPIVPPALPSVRWGAGAAPPASLVMSAQESRP